MIDELKMHQYKEKLRLFGYAERTIYDAVKMLLLFVKYLEEKENIKSLQLIQPEHVKSYQSYMTFEKFEKAGKNNGTHHLSQNTVRGRLMHLRTFFRIMHQENLLPHYLGTYIVLPKKRKYLPKNIPSPEQMRQLIQAAVPDSALGIRDRFMLELMYATGIRNTEIRTATIHDLSIQERTLFVAHGKGGVERIVPIGEWVLPYALEYLHTSRPYLLRLVKSELLFPTRNGWMIDASMLNKLVQLYRKKANLALKLSPHTFRHACATHMLQQGADIRYVQELLGHADLGSTQIYTKVTIGDLKKAHAKYHPANKNDF
jgi:integrase/recombinase XerD